MGWPRRLASGLLLMLAVAVAAAAVAVADIPWLPWWGQACVALVAFLAGLLLDPFKTIVTDWVEQPGRQYASLRTHTRMHDRRGRIRRVRSCGEKDSAALGVKPALYDPAAPAGLTVYVQREVETGGRGSPTSELAAAFAEGGLVIIEGPSAAGKTRTAFEAMRRYAPDRWLIVPDGSASLAALKNDRVRLSRSVVWLDDIDDYLVTGAVDAGVLDAFCPPGGRDVILLGTLRSEARAVIAEMSGQDSQVRRAFGDVGRRARFISLHRELTQSEAERASALRSSDPRIAAALDHHETAGFAEYLAAAPAVLQRWQSARRGENLPAGAIISAAIDARLISFFALIGTSRDLATQIALEIHGKKPLSAAMSTIPAAVLEELYAAYLPRQEVHRLRQPDFREALDWAAQPVSGASSCLVPVGKDTYQVFDYLLDSVAASARSGGYHLLRDVPQAALDVFLPRFDAFELAGMVTELRKAGRYEVADSAYKVLVAKGRDVAYIRDYKGEDDDDWLLDVAEAGNSSAMCDVAVLAFDKDDRRQAEYWFRRAADLGNVGAMNNLGLLGELAGDTDTAAQWYRRAARAGHADAMNNLAILLQAAGEGDAALRWWSRAAGEGEETARRNQQLVGESGGVGADGAWYRVGPETWHLAVGEVMIWATREDGEPDPLQLLREVAGAGDRRAMAKLASIPDKTGAEYDWRRRMQYAAIIATST